MPELDNSAILTFYNITFSEPEVLKDGSPFTDYYNYSYNTSTNILEFTVISGLGKFEIREKPAEPVTPPPTSGSGGGGSTIDYIIEPSLEITGCQYVNYTCVWGECIDGIRTEICTATDNVNVTCDDAKRPIEQTEACSGDEEDKTGVVSRFVSFITGFSVRDTLAQRPTQIGGVIAFLVLITGTYLLVRHNKKKHSIKKQISKDLNENPKEKSDLTFSLAEKDN
jgi:hypothetical protein